jgi:Fe-S-cluster containining protein
MQQETERNAKTAVVPFGFHCHRCGHCCSGGEGRVWLEEVEIEPLARRLGLDSETFARGYVRSVFDAERGVQRLALRERNEGAGGACILLEGSNHCTVYADRPQQCRSFPYWPSVLTDEAAFERARSICPGIAPLVPDEVRARAFAALEALYADFEAFVERARPVCIRRGVCCRFEEAGHELFATGLEADYAASRHPDAREPEAPGRCPYHVSGRCTAREGRPLGCRSYYCDTRTETVLAEAHEAFLEQVRRIERETGYPPSYGRFPALLRARGIGVADAPAGEGVA